NVVDFSPQGIDIGANYSDVVHGHNDFTRMSLGASFSLNDNYFNFITELTYSTELKRPLYHTSFAQKITTQPSKCI
ncbi:TPA: hypothetical protein ACWYKR_005568, partial [Klebsiella pneumoniae]